MADIIFKDTFWVPVGTHVDKDIVVAADHRGFDYKEALKEHFAGKGYKVRDKYSRSDNSLVRVPTIIDAGSPTPGSSDYPLFSMGMGRILSGDWFNMQSEGVEPEYVGVGICGSGNGIVGPASKYIGVIEARVLNPDQARSARKHNNANLIGIPADEVPLEVMLETVDAFMEEPFQSNPKQEESYLRRCVQTYRGMIDATAANHDKRQALIKKKQ